MCMIIRVLLPQGPPFQHATVVLKDAPDEQHELYFCDIIACSAFLFSNPDYKKVIDYEPEEIFVTDRNGAPTRNVVYAELSSSRIWNEEQFKLSEQGLSDSTILAIMLGSDKTHLTKRCILCTKYS
ncbi:uncharacterized protein EI90DRAFT_3130954 [Cantharellus anzutake]|uniref:uncharacterized protein n=1 Tax=Cantharellus anzutake TaxID=1750568 RepID=UPI0019083BDA|nr:uncharacterized protein EI90DRAFT_3130954 [Cantharellus anzutake]KAF8322401.1 hypothetical protein EI90DRAFT_3130954 [Cantharellus anzutake]